MTIDKLNLLIEAISEAKPEFNNGLEIRVIASKLDLNHIIKQINIKVIAQELVDSYGVKTIQDEIKNIETSKPKKGIILDTSDFFCESLENIGFRLNLKGIRFEFEANGVDSKFLQNIPLKDVLIATFNENNNENIKIFKDTINNSILYEQFFEKNDTILSKEPKSKEISKNI